MQIERIYDISLVFPLHEEIFGEEFPIESYNRKRKNHNLLIFIYHENDKRYGYSIVIDQEEEKNLYAWYGGVLPEMQGKGITDLFFDSLINIAEQMKYKSITVATSNLRPHMLRFAIKKGFDIYDIKKRDTGEGNKIYFRYQINEPYTCEIDLVQNGKYIKPVEVEALLVYHYKNNCNRYVFRGLDNFETLKYAIKYLNSLSNKAEVVLKESLDNDQCRYLKTLYSGIIIF